MQRRPPTQSGGAGKTPLKRLEFGRVDIIPAAGQADESPRTPVIYALRRSPTPLIELDNIPRLTEEHLTQLNAVWKEGKLPTFAADSREISTTMAALSGSGRDPFD